MIQIIQPLNDHYYFFLSVHLKNCTMPLATPSSLAVALDPSGSNSIAFENLQRETACTIEPPVPHSCGRQNKLGAEAPKLKSDPRIIFRRTAIAYFRDGASPGRYAVEPWRKRLPGSASSRRARICAASARSRECKRR